MDTIKKLVEDKSLSKYTGALSGLNASVNSPSYLTLKSIADNFAVTSFRTLGYASY